MAPAGLAVWVARTQPGADETARRLKVLGHRPLIAPVLEVRALAGLAIDLKGVGALAFTSANGVRAFAGLCPLRDLPVFAVGDTTAASAKAEGFVAVSSASGDVAALAAHIAAARNGFSGLLLHPCAVQPAGDLVGYLARAGVTAGAVAVYDTHERETLPDLVASALEDEGLDVVLIHSPRAAGVVRRLLDTPVRRAQAQRLSVVGLSPACLASLETMAFARTAVANRPTDDDLIAELGRL
jgi:uroporphyrinogen-III synthase